MNCILKRNLMKIRNRLMFLISSLHRRLKSSRVLEIDGAPLFSTWQTAHLSIVLLPMIMLLNHGNWSHDLGISSALSSRVSFSLTYSTALLLLTCSRWAGCCTMTYFSAVVALHSRRFLDSLDVISFRLLRHSDLLNSSSPRGGASSDMHAVTSL